MLPAWQVLRRTRVPIGTREGRTEIDAASLPSAVRDVLATHLTERERVSLLAWLRAWASEWPRSFESTFGPEGPVLIARAADGEWDLGKYLKLRRVARDGLATVI